MTPGSRYVKTPSGVTEKRPRAADQSITRRAAFDEASVPLGEGKLKVGDAASSRGRLCTVIEIDYEADTCKLSFDLAGVHLTREYPHIYKACESHAQSMCAHVAHTERGPTPVVPITSRLGH